MDTDAFVITVVPKGDEEGSSEARTFWFKCGKTSKDELRNAARRHIIEKKLIDKDSFERYWEIAAVRSENKARDTPDPSPSQFIDEVVRLKNKLPSSLTPQIGRQIRANTGKKPRAISVYSRDTTGRWSHVPFCVPLDCAIDFDAYKQTLRLNNPSIYARTKQELGEAIIRAAVRNDPTLPDTFDADDPSDHEYFIRTSMDSQKVIIDELKSL